MKNKLQILLTLLTIMFALNSTLMALYYGGSGTPADPYRINTMQHLYDIVNTSADWDKHFIQTADIVISGISGNFGVIGNTTTKFTGSYNGQGHTITDLTNSYASNYVGLFGFINNATIEHLGLVNVTVLGEVGVGGLVGYAAGTSVIEDCYTTGTVSGTNGTGKAKDVGGLIGAAITSTITVKNSFSECNVSSNGGYGVGGFIGRNSGSITGCYASGSVSGSGSEITSYWGGFVGENNEIISNCYAIGSVTGSGSSASKAGGFVGYNNQAQIELCYATGSVTDASEAGGFAGRNYASSTSYSSIIERSYSTGNVSSTLNVGGFIGRITYGDVKNCYSLGDVTKPGGGGTSYGGFCGDITNVSTIEHCYSTGKVIYSANPTDKGFVGSETTFSGSYDANFFNTTTSNQATATGATGKNHDDMNDDQTFVLVSNPWDIIGVQGAGSNNYWEMNGSVNNGYPFIRSNYTTPTKTVTAVTENSATCGGNIFDNGSRDITAFGICWSTSPAPTTADPTVGTTPFAPGAFTVSLTGLSASTTYYVRAYVTNNVGTSYGEEESFTTTAATPVELVSFTADFTSSGTVQLNWETATEINNYGFEVQRTDISSQISEREWETLGFVEGHGNSVSPKYYEFVDESPLADSAEYRLKQIDTDGGFEYYAERVQVAGYSTTGVEDETLQLEYKLAQNYPNPFNPTTQIAFTIPSAGIVKLNVYNVLGEVIAELVNQNLEAGLHEYEFNASNLTSGIYFYSISVNGFREVRKMNLVK